MNKDDWLLLFLFSSLKGYHIDTSRFLIIIIASTLVSRVNIRHAANI